MVVDSRENYFQKETRVSSRVKCCPGKKSTAINSHKNKSNSSQPPTTGFAAQITSELQRN